MGDERSVAASEPGTDERSVAASEPGTDERSVAASEPGTDERSVAASEPGTDERSVAASEPGTDERSVAASEPGTDERSVAASEPGTDERSVAASEPGTDERSGFVTLIGRPNAGKSTLLNKILGFKVSIVSDKPQTTRTQIRGVLNRPGAQLVFVDTPGIHKPRTALGTSLNATANQASSEVDVVCFVLDGTARYGRGDASIAERLPKDSVIVVTKADIASHQQIAQQLAATAHLDAAQWFPLSGRTGEGIADLVDYLTERMPLGPRLYPAEMLTDVGDEFWVAELVREKLLALTRDELPHSLATRVTEWEWPRIRCEILVERESQKPMVIGKGGEVLKKVGTAVRSEIGEEVFIELFVKVEKNWQRRPELVQRLGY